MPRQLAGQSHQTRVKSAAVQGQQLEFHIVDRKQNKSAARPTPGGHRSNLAQPSPEDDCPFEVAPPVTADTDQAATDREPNPTVLPKADLLMLARQLADAIAQHLARPVRLFVTNNRSTMISFRRTRDLLILRVHHMFLSAPEPVVRAIGEYAVRSSDTASKIIDDFVHQHRASIRADVARFGQPRLNARGRVWNLKEIFDRLNHCHFNGQINARIGWSRGVRGRRRRTIRMGVYDHLTRTIRLHPALDCPEVPQFFVEYIVFHEMLHQAVPYQNGGQRRRHHGKEFQARERTFPDYHRAIAWEQANLGLLLGRPVTSPSPAGSKHASNG